MGRLYLKSSREIKRLEALGKTDRADRIHTSLNEAGNLVERLGEEETAILFMPF